MNKQLAKPWEYVFSNFLPASMDSLAEALGNVLQSFRLRMSQRAELMKAPSFALTSRQIKSLERSLEDATASKAMISTGQKEASRLLVQIVSKKMTKAYTSCSEEYGEHIPLHQRYTSGHGGSSPHRRRMLQAHENASYSAC